MNILTILTLINPLNPPSENHDFSATKHPVDLKPAYKLDKVRELLFPNREIEIFDDFCRFSTKFLRG